MLHLLRSKKTIVNLDEVYRTNMGQVLDAQGRTNMTVSCKDSMDIPKVKNAGETVSRDGKDFQVMHEGTLVLKDAYHGEWMSDIIKLLRGHHEPQEEKAFHEVLARIDSDKPSMIELGCFWAYYSIWFARKFKSTNSVAAEPSRENLAIGKLDAKVNKVDISFVNAAAGNDSTEPLNITENEQTYEVKVASVAELMSKYGVDTLDVLHMDIQGAELEALEGARGVIEEGRIRFAIVSTHHHSISLNPNIHIECLDLIRDLGGYIVCEHSIYESFSGDGLIVASFKDIDRDFTIALSNNRNSKGLFPSPEQDLKTLASYLS